MSVVSLALMVGGGLAYTVGAFVLFLNDQPFTPQLRLPRGLARVAASGCHFAMVCLLVAATQA